MIGSVTTSLNLLKLIASHPDSGLSELSRLSNINKSRTFRMLNTLCEAGYVYQSADSSYRLGHQALIIGQAARQQIGLLKVAEPEIELLAEQFDENIQIRVRDGMEVMQIYSRRCQQKLQVNSNVGNFRPLGNGASGQLLLAYISEDEIRSCTPEQQANYEKLAIVRKAQLAKTYAELSPDIGAIAVPLFDYKQNCVACLSVSVPLTRLNSEYEDKLTHALQETGKRISVALGAQINHSQIN